MPPVAVVGNLVARTSFLVSRTNRHCQCLYATLCGNETAVAVGLFLIRVVVLNEHTVIAIQLLIPLNGTEKGRGE